MNISVEQFSRIVFLLLYVPVGLFTYWRLFPRLLPSAKLLAIVLLAAQMLAIGVSLYLQPGSSFEVWLWDLHGEWNIPATLASTQLALVGAVALLTAWFARERPVWQRIYMVGICVVFVILALDEYYMVHEHIQGWYAVYIALGASLVVATLALALRSPRRAWIWHVCLLGGLAISALGAIHIERFGSICGDFGLLYIDECPSNAIWPWEEYLEFLGIWLTLLAMLGHFSDVFPSPQVRVQRALFAFPALWILVLVLSAAMQPIARQVSFHQPAAVEFESGESLHAYRIEQEEIGFAFHIYLSPAGWDFNGLGYSISLVDQVSGNVVANRDRYANVRLEFYLGPGYAPVYRQWTRIAIPPGTPVNRALWVLLTLWRRQGGEFRRQEVLASDHQLLDETQVVLGELVLPAVSDNTRVAPVAVFDNGFTLESVDLPERGRPGEVMTIPFTWRSEVAGDEDHVQFLHLGHAESGEWWIYDQHPLGRRLPTRLWYSGLEDRETWQVPIPADLAPGSYNIFTGLYRARDNVRVPVSDAEGRPWVDARVSLGILTLD